MFFTFIGIISAVLLACTIICGLWIKLNNRNNDSNSHFTFSILSIVFSLLIVVSFLVKK
ncbi:hypothetical protein [Clostridioides sp. ZZV15-6598]|uniref:hypothetical protein n=1 Tax=Clostridioides sp. ZZV15-6598 TaxID=2811501 RepID=UPI001D10EEEE|nr:hypothetical protein [Clostridioides sp. ZZV15-6598]